MGVRVPRFQKMPYQDVAFLINHINIVVSTKRRWIFFRITKKTLKLTLLLVKLGLINFPHIVKKSPIKWLMKVSPFFYKRTTFYSCIRLVSTPSKSFTVTLKTLQILSHSLGESTIILETSLGFMTNQDALRHKVGGRILLVLS